MQHFLNAQPEDVLKKIYGYENFRFNQNEVIDCVLKGDDVVCLMPTGGGKSLCYQIPSLIKNGTGVVISPLIALMQNQVEALQSKGIRAAFLNSSQSQEDAQVVKTALQSGELDILYLAPERLLMASTLSLLQQVEPALFAIDEAHCVSQWGHDFRPEYQKLSIINEYFPNVPRLALTATADSKTLIEIKKSLHLSEAQTFINSFDRPNITYSITQGNKGKDKLLDFILKNYENQSGIVYCLSRKKTEETAKFLKNFGLKAMAYHAGMENSERTKVQNTFINEEGSIICATVAFGMGIDKADVRFVAHLNLPKNIEAYYQESGRAGRDGKPAEAWMCYSLQDVILLRSMNQDSCGSQKHKKVLEQKLNALLSFCESSTCRRKALLAYFGEHKEDCNNCDNCLNPPEMLEAGVAAKKALSAVYRTGQRFGVNYLIDHLLGKADERMKRNGHHRVSTFGIGKELPPDSWRNIFRQLTALDYIHAPESSKGGLSFTDKAQALLQGNDAFFIRKDQDKSKGANPYKAKKKAPPAIAEDSEDRPLYEDLKALRSKLAEVQNVPAFVIFSDKTLRSMSSEKPQTSDEMLAISGVGLKKLQAYGEDFLGVIRDF